MSGSHGLQGRTPLHHQVQAYKRVTAHPRAVLALPTGSGKTTVAQMVVAEVTRSPSARVLWLSPSIELGRQSECSTLQVLPHLTTGTFDTPGVGKRCRPGICPVQVVYGTYKRLTDAYGQWLRTIPWSLVVVDESSLIGDKPLPLLRELALKAPRALVLNATPYGNDARSIWKAIAAAGVGPWPTERQFVNAYCYVPENGNAWEDAPRLTTEGGEQVQRLVAPYVYQRHWPELMASAKKRRDAASLTAFRFPKRLPEETLWLPLHADQHKALEAAQQDAQRRRQPKPHRTAVEAILDGASLVPTSAAYMLRVAAAVEWVAGRVHLFPKHMVFSERVDQAKAYAEAWEEQELGKVLLLTGESGKRERQDAVAAFREDPEVTCLVGTKVLETGLNLESANLLVNLGITWAPHRETQREGRIARIGSQHASYQVLNVLVEHDLEKAKLRTHERKLVEAQTVLPINLSA